jgi:uncharacterized alpha-E superfamily protein
MLSRVADHLYWMSRYMERVENLARLVQVSMELLLDAAVTGNRSMESYWSPVLAATAMEESFATLYPNPQPGDIALFLTTDEQNPDSIYSCIKLARENARTVRDQISDEMWAELNELFLFIGSKSAQSLFHRSPQSFYEKIIQSALLFEGITAATLPRSEGWYFLQLGRFLERADKTSRFLDIKTHTTQSESSNQALDSIQWSTILRSCSAFATFRRAFGAQVNIENVVELLLFSTEFPRSVRFCLRHADELLHQVSGVPTGQYSNSAEKITGSLLAKLNFSSSADVLQQGLHDFVDELQATLNSVGQSVFENYVLLPREVNRLVVRHPSAEAAAFQQQQQQQ